MKPNKQVYPTQDFGGTGITTRENGLTIRDHIAIEAMKGLISNQAVIMGISKKQRDIEGAVASISYKYADALIKESLKTND
jgi:hypothetical protein